jgi:hypothetical protein
MAVARGEGCRRRRTGLRAGSSRRTGRPRRRRGAGLLTDARACTPQVVVLEKGRYTKAADLSLKEREAVDSMYESGSLMTTEDAGARSGRRPAAGPVAAVRWPPHATLRRVTRASVPLLVVTCGVCMAWSSLHPGPAQPPHVTRACLCIMGPRAHMRTPLRSPCQAQCPGGARRRAPPAVVTLRARAAGVSILAGATLGGGTRINWQASFRTPAHVGRRARPDGLRVAALRPRAGRRLAALRRHHR